MRHAEILVENNRLRDSIETLTEKLHQYNYIYGFKNIKPMIIPKDTNLTEGKESEFYLLVAGQKFDRHGRPYQTNYDLNSNLKNEMNWATIKGEDILTYRPLSSGKDTIKVEFHFQDPDSIESMRFPVEYPVEVKMKNTATNNK